MLIYSDNNWEATEILMCNQIKDYRQNLDQWRRRRRKRISLPHNYTTRYSKRLLCVEDI